MSKLSVTSLDYCYDYSGEVPYYSAHQVALLSLYTQLALLFVQNAEVLKDTNRNSESVCFVVLQHQTSY